MSEFSNYIGKYIQKQRESFAMSKRDLAKILGITPSKLNDIELGNTLPELELLQLMQSKCGFLMDSCVEFLLNWQGKNKTKSTNKKISKLQICYTKDNFDTNHQI